MHRAPDNWVLIRADQELANETGVSWTMPIHQHGNVLRKHVGFDRLSDTEELQLMWSVALGQPHHVDCLRDGNQISGSGTYHTRLSVLQQEV